MTFSPVVHPRRRTVTAVLAASPLLALAACGSAAGTADEPLSEEERTAGGTLRIYSSTTSVDPRQQHGPWGRALADSLVDRDPETQEFSPWLAEEFTVDEDSTEFTFVLREGITFSDGTALDAAAVAANLDGAVQDLEQGGGWYVRGLFDHYEGTEQVDELTAVVRFSEPNVAFLPTVATSQLAIIAPTEFERTLEERALTGVVGSGPFVLDEVTPDESIRLVRREDYAWQSSLARHDGDASLEAIEIGLVTEIGVQTSALQSGEVDLIQTNFPADVITQIEATGSKIAYRSQVGIGMSIEINFHDPLTSQLPVRRALQKAIDREAVSSLVYGATSPAATSIITSSTFGHAEFSADLLARDVDAAKTILEDDGWALGEDGIYAKDGTRLSLSYITWTGALYEDLSALIKEQYAEAGIELNLTFDATAPSIFTDSGEHALHFRNTTRADPDVLRKVYGNAAHEGDPAILYTDSAAVTSSGTELEEVLQASSVESDEDQRIELLHRAQEILLEDALRIPVVDNAVYVVGYAPNVQSIWHNSLSEPVLHDVWLAEG